MVLHIFPLPRVNEFVREILKIAESEAGLCVGGGRADVFFHLIDGYGRPVVYCPYERETKVADWHTDIRGYPRT